MEIGTLNNWNVPNYPIVCSSDHQGNVYAYNYQFPNENLSRYSPEAFVQNDISASSPTLNASNSFYYLSPSLNSSISNENPIDPISSVRVAKNKRGRKKGEQAKVYKRNEKRSESPASPTTMKKRRLAANTRERRRMNGLNTAFDK